GAEDQWHRQGQSPGQQGRHRDHAAGSAACPGEEGHDEEDAEEHREPGAEADSLDRHIDRHCGHDHEQDARISPATVEDTTRSGMAKKSPSVATRNVVSPSRPMRPKKTKETRARIEKTIGYFQAIGATALTGAEGVVSTV